jgi:virginiamycin B lyase
METKVKKTASWLTAGLLLPVLLFVTWLTAAQPLRTTAGFITEYAIPAGNSDPFNIVVEAPGRVWFTMPSANAIGSLVVTSTVDYDFTLYPVPTAGSEPYDLAFDGSAIWFTERAGNRIGRLDLATRTISDNFLTLAPGSAPTGIAVAPDGAVWFAQRDGNRIGRYNPATMTLTEYSYNMAGGQPEDIAVLNNNNIWFTAPGVMRVVLLTPSTGTFLSVPVQTSPGSPLVAPGGIAVDNSAPWISAPDLDLIGRYAPGTLALWRWYALPIDGSRPTALVYHNAAGQPQVWFVETAGGRVGQLITDANGNPISIRTHQLPTANSQPTGIALDANGRVWIAENGSGMIAEWSPPYFHLTFLPGITKP